jgi:hypothetical protein
MKTRVTVGEKEKLITKGIRNRSQFLSDYSAELTKPSTAISVRQSYSSLFDYVLGSSPYVFISVKLETTDIKRAVDARKSKAGGLLPGNFIRLGREYYEARRSGETARNAMEALWNKFLVRVNRKVLGSKYKRYGQSLRWIGVHENSGKQYARRQTNHLHMLLEIPSRYRHQEFEHLFREQFSSLVYPLSSTTSNSSVLNIRPGRLTGIYPHPEYIQKQLVDWETASDRVFLSAIPVTNGSVNFLLGR